MQVPISDDSAFFTVTCFAIWRNTLWVGTNRGTIAVMDTNDGRCVHEIFFPGGRRKQVEIKDLAISSENEVCVMAPPIHLGAWSIALMLWLPFGKPLQNHLDSYLQSSYHSLGRSRSPKMLCIQLVIITTHPHSHTHTLTHTLTDRCGAV